MPSARRAALPAPGRRPALGLGGAAAVCWALRRCALCAFFVAAAAALAQTPPAPASAAAPRPAAMAASSTAGNALRLGSVVLTPCEVGTHYPSALPSFRAFCTRFAVPEDWAEPGGRHIELHVALIKSLAAAADRDLVTFLDGGPGGAATEDYPALAAALQPLRKHHHILLVDQRGTGASNPLDCDADVGLAADRPSLQTAAAAADSAKAAIHRCLAQLRPRAAPQFYTTSLAARDLEALRLAMGGVALDLVGVSYGTRVAQQYAARYPQAVRSVILDSPVPNRLALSSEHARNLEDALRARLQLCRATPACAQRYGDPYASLQAVRTRLRRAPVAVELRDAQSFVSSRDRLTAEDWAQLVRFYLYNDFTSALLPLLIDEARAERFGPILAQARLMVGDVSEHLSNGMAASVLCAEDADLLQDQPGDADTLLGTGVLQSARATCALWPHGARPADFHSPWHSALPVLVLSGEFDPVTPQRYGAEIVGALPRARLLVVPGQGHAVLSAGCVPRLAEAFVKTLDPVQLDAACLRRLRATPAFLGPNGAAP